MFMLYTLKTSYNLTHTHHMPHIRRPPVVSEPTCDMSKLRNRMRRLWSMIFTSAGHPSRRTTSSPFTSSTGRF